MAIERLQKIVSAAGIASRRKAEQMILEGRVTVNGAIITELGSKADLDRDHVKVDGKLLHRPKTLLYLAMNKPVGCVTTVTDPEGRETVMDLLRGLKERVYPVGRLDYHSEGLLLFTNDGDFANAITAAVHHIPKTYLVKVTGTLTAEQEEAFRHGLPISGRKTKPAGIRLVRRAENPWYEVRLFEGRKNQIRMMFKHLGFLVEKLKRVQIGTLSLGSLKPGQFRFLDAAEVARLRKSTLVRTKPE
jgi:23S rRNA pseudouridine2605 synthase